MNAIPEALAHVDLPWKTAEVVHTGGGCRAFRIAGDDGHGHAYEVLITDRDEATFDTDGPYTVGIYDLADDACPEALRTTESADIASAVVAAAVLWKVNFAAAWAAP